MHRIIAIALITTLASCAQATRHSNTLLFTTNTVGGLKVGVDEKQIPQILMGYTRFEGVFMPLVANTAENADGDLTPCPVEGAPGGQHIIPKDCLLQGENGAADRDSYSVLATFSGSAAAKGGNGGSASGSVAQYFATGLAARELARYGGAAAIATGDAARESTRGSELQTLLNDPDVMNLANALKTRKDANIAIIKGNYDQIPGSSDTAKINWVGQKAGVDLTARGIDTKDKALNWLQSAASTAQVQKVSDALLGEL